MNGINRKSTQFWKHCVGETNETCEHYTFKRRDQEHFEFVDSFVATLWTVAKTCNYDALEESLIGDMMVIWIHHNATRKRQLQKSNLTLKDTFDTCHSHETAARILKSLSSVEYVQTMSKIKSQAQQTQIREWWSKSEGPSIFAIWTATSVYILGWEKCNW